MKAEKPPRCYLRAREGRRDEFSSPLSKNEWVSQKWTWRGERPLSRGTES